MDPTVPDHRREEDDETPVEEQPAHKDFGGEDWYWWTYGP